MTAAPIRVLQLGSPTGLYGAERWILALVRHLPAHIQSIVAALKDEPGPTPPVCLRAAEFGFDTHVFESHGRFNPASVRLLRDYLRSERIDVLHTHGYKTDLLGLLAARGTACKVLSTPHGWNPNENWKVRAYEALDRLVLSQLDAVAPLSQQLYDDLVRVPGMRKKLHLIGNGVDLAEITAAIERESTLLQWKVGGAWIIGYIGRLAGPKRLDSLMQAFAAVDIPNKRLCLVGEGPARAALEQMASDLGVSERVHFFGYREDRIAFLNCFDVFVLPSESEGTPRCLMEAMTARVPVIATDIRGCRLLIKDASMGWLFDVGDHETLAQHLLAVHKDPPAVQQKMQLGRAFVEANYSAEAMAFAYAQLFVRMVSASHTKPALAPASNLE